jgi:hypothetical protein
MPTGLDLGTGLTRVAWQGTGSGDQDDDDFRTSCVPTAVLYRGLDGEIPAFSPGIDELAAGVRCDGFPMLLDGSPRSRIPEWGNRTPVEAAQAFLRLLLGPGGRGDGDLVVAVPAASSKLGEILAAIGVPPRRLISAPAAAVTYLRHSRPDLSAATRFIVCDVGAGFMSIALCTAGPRATVVTDSIQLVGAAAWSDDTTPLASNDGRPDTLAERLVAALALTQGAPTVGRSVRRWRGLEATLRQGDGDWPRALTDGSGRAWSGHGPSILRFADLELTAGEFLGACAPLAERAGTALRTLLTRQPDPDWRDVAGTRIVLLGGLSVLWPVRESLLRAAGLDPVTPGAPFVDLDASSRLEAAARGAALLAAGKTGATERYPHSLRLPVHRVLRGETEVEHLPLAAAGTIDYEQPERVLRDATGEPYLVTVVQGPAPLPVEIVPNGTGTPVPAVLRPPTPPAPGQYRIAIGGGADGVTVVLHRADGSGAHRYVLDGSGDSPGTAGAGRQAEGGTRE